MRMRDEDILDIGRIETQCANAVQDGIGGVSVRRVNQDQPAVCSNQIRAHSLEADIVSVVENLERSFRIMSGILPRCTPWRPQIPIGSSATLGSSLADQQQEHRNDHQKVSLHNRLFY